MAQRQAPAHFSRIGATFGVLTNFFFGANAGGGGGGGAAAARIGRTLRLYSLSAERLMSRYLAARYKMQSALSTAAAASGGNHGGGGGPYPYGSVTVRAAMLQGTHVRVEVLNARHLKPGKNAHDIQCSSHLLYFMEYGAFKRIHCLISHLVPLSCLSLSLSLIIPTAFLRRWPAMDDGYIFPRNVTLW